MDVTVETGQWVEGGGLCVAGRNDVVLVSGTRETFTRKERRGAYEKSQDWRPGNPVPEGQAAALGMDELSDGGEDRSGIFQEQNSKRGSDI